MGSGLVVNNLEVVYEKNGEPLTAVKDVSITVKANEFVCLLGPSGCGKTSILKAIAGFIKPNRGAVALDGMAINKPTKQIGVVFQHHALFPWKTVKDNIGLGPKLNGIPKNDVDRIVSSYLKIIGLEEYAGYYPSELSVGMQQRVGIARALVNNPGLVLMDEPFGSLDALTRKKMQEELLRIWEQNKTTILFVSHDIDEALILADRIIVMTKRPGKILKEVMNSLPRPRGYEMTVERKFLEQKALIMSSLTE